MQYWLILSKIEPSSGERQCLPLNGSFSVILTKSMGRQVCDQDGRDHNQGDCLAFFQCMWSYHHAARTCHRFIQQNLIFTMIADIDRNSIRQHGHTIRVCTTGYTVCTTSTAKSVISIRPDRLKASHCASANKYNNHACIKLIPK